MICPKCSGSGRVRNVAMGLGEQGLVPAYAEMPCPVCFGDGDVYDDQPYGSATCGRCEGRGYIVDMTVGLGPEGFVPAYREVTCPGCDGAGYLE